ncbi:MAG TPA: hypothetical protein VIJ38_12505 [Acidobacteriaceae bacterium]
MVKNEHKGASSNPRHIYMALGFMAFAPVVPAPVGPAHGSMFTAAHRSGLSASKPDGSSPSENLDPVVSEQDLYGK